MYERNPFRNYDAWLEAPIQREYAAQEQYADACDRAREDFEEYLEDLSGWFMTLHTSYVASWDRTRTWGSILDEFEASPVFQGRVEGILEEWNGVETGPDPDDYNEEMRERELNRIEQVYGGDDE